MGRVCRLYRLYRPKTFDTDRKRLIIAGLADTAHVRTLPATSAAPGRARRPSDTHPELAESDRIRLEWLETTCRHSRHAADVAPRERLKMGLSR
jgi:hypothetical protein